MRIDRSLEEAEASRKAARPVGTGLGLHIAYNIVVNRHQGQIQVASRPGETRLRVVLPIHLAASNAR